MRIVLDFNPALRHRYSGFWTYGVGLLQGLVRLEQVERVSLLCSRKLLPNASEIAEWRHPKSRPIVTRLRLRELRQWWRLVYWPNLQRWCGDFDVYHGIHLRMPPTAGRPRIMTVHDLRRYRLPQLYPKRELGSFERAVAVADRIIAISQSTKSDLISLLQVPPERIDVVHLGTPAGFAPVGESGQHAAAARVARVLGGRAGPYVLAISSRDPRKNLSRAILAFARAAANLPGEFRLEIVGHPPEDPEVDRALCSTTVGPRVTFTGPLNDEDLAAVLAGAEMFLYLSLYEGFGLPILEAMASGTPVIAADRSSLPEVVGEAGLLVDPEDVEQIAQRILNVAGNPHLRHTLSQAGLARAAQFTWARAASQTLESYERAMRCR
jgi:glycosyltransferase involved in cell wall biosynthesis